MMNLRQKLFGLFLTLSAVLLFSVSAWAADTPKDTLSVVIDEVITVLKDPGYANPETRSPLRQKIVEKVEGVFDFYEFSARTVGAKWKGFTDEQQRRFNEAFARLLMVTYLDNISGYNGEKVEYTGEKLSKKGDRAEVATVITLSDGKKVPLNYRMMKKNKWVVYDVIIENISLIKNYRSQFKDALTKESVEQLITRVIDRAKELEKKN